MGARGCLDPERAWIRASLWFSSWKEPLRLLLGEPWGFQRGGLMGLYHLPPFHLPLVFLLQGFSGLFWEQSPYRSSIRPMFFSSLFENNFCSPSLPFLHDPLRVNLLPFSSWGWSSPPACTVPALDLGLTVFTHWLVSRVISGLGRVMPGFLWPPSRNFLGCYSRCFPEL